MRVAHHMRKLFAHSVGASVSRQTVIGICGRLFGPHITFVMTPEPLVASCYANEKLNKAEYGSAPLNPHVPTYDFAAAQPLTHI